MLQNKEAYIYMNIASSSPRSLGNETSSFLGYVLTI